MDLINDPPTLSDFYSDMNKHSNSEYQIRDNHVIEMERDHKRGTAKLTVWTAQRKDGKYVPGRKQPKYHWYIKAVDHLDEYDEDILELLAESQMHFDDFVDTHSGGVVEPRTDLKQ